MFIFLSLLVKLCVSGAVVPISNDSVPRRSDLAIAVIGDDFVSGYAAKELGASYRGINFLSGADSNSHSLFQQLHNQTNTHQQQLQQQQVRVIGGARGMRPTSKCLRNQTQRETYFCPANDLLELEEDDWEMHRQADGLTLALEGMGIDSLGRALKILRKRLKRNHITNSTQVWLFVHLGLNDVCQRACTDWSLADHYVTKVQNFLNTCENSGGQFSRIFLLGLLDLSQLYHNYHFRIKKAVKQNTSSRGDASYFEKRTSQWCPCFHTDQARISMLQVTHDINQRLAQLAKTQYVHFLDLSGFDLFQPNILAADHFHLNPLGHQLLASHIYSQIVQILV